ncbi:hypothetical protein BGX24_007627 [Mortierella sp. AD032]|nr:hypothetical protein BGX24_007627 [Mortierella sp. AD032]
MFPPRPPEEGERFLAYLPHSGFHNQLITLENALRLAVSLNRTLLLPPLYLSQKKQALVWKEPPVLLKQWSDRNRTGVDYCRTIEPATWPRKSRKQREAMTEQERKTEHECRFYHLWTTTPWTYFYDIPKLLSDIVSVGGETTPIRVFSRPVITMEWLKEHLHVQDLQKDMYFFNDTSRYEYLIKDDSEVDYGVKPEDEDPSSTIPETTATSGKFSKHLLLTDLQRRPEKILHFGSLFATDRFEARSQRQKDLKLYISKGMDLWNQAIMDATRIAEEQIDTWSKKTGRLAPGFLGVHLRTEDGIFEKGAPMNLQRIASWLGEMVKQDRQRYLTLSTRRRRRADSDAAPVPVHATQPTSQSAEAQQAPALPQAAAPAPSAFIPIPSSATSTNDDAILTFLERCQSSPPESPMIFMATDVHQPRSAPLLQDFLVQFPCTMFLSDFRESDALLEKIRNPVDNVLMWPYMVALMDANLAAKGRLFQGTDRSTFTSYIYNHLWPEYHPEAMG